MSAEAYRAAFLAILRGGAPSPNQSAISSDHAFFVIARNTRSLQELQALCTSSEAPSGCLTARYRIRTGPALGTLIAAFASDLLLLNDFDPGYVSPPQLALSGDLLPAWGPNVRDIAWGRLSRSSAWVSRVRTMSATGTLDLSWVIQFFRELGVGPGSALGTQLVLFGEVEEPGEVQEWLNDALSLLPALPSGVGIVVAGAPPEFRIPSDGSVPVRSLELEVPKVDPQTVDVLRYTEAALSGDQTAKRDRLNVGRYAAALSRLVLLPETKPLTIGIHGPWGSGKSSFMELIRQELVKQAVEKDAPALSKVLDDVERQLQAKEHELLTAKPEQQAALDTERGALDDERERRLIELEAAIHRRVIPVLFNAWRYENATQIWAGLSAAISSRLESAVPLWVRVRTRAAYALRLRGAEFWLGFVAPVVATLVIGALLFMTGLGLGAEVSGKLPDWLDWLSAVLPLTPAVVTIAFVAWRFYRLARPLGERVAGYVSPLNYREQLGFQHQVLDDLQFIRTAVSRWFHPGRAGASARARAPLIVVFIDDLDRCSQDHIMEVLQAINLILGASDFFVFLGIDTEMIYRAIADHYHLETDSPQAEIFPANYVRKIIQLSFHLPDASPEGRFNFVSQLFSPTARSAFFQQTLTPAGTAPPADGQLGPLGFDRRLVMPVRVQVVKNVVDTKDELKALDDFKLFIQGNPRELKRLVNVHRLTKILLQRSEAPLTPARQRKLVEWLIFCARWPDLVDDVMACARNTPEGQDAIQQLIQTCDMGTEATDIDTFWQLMGPDGIIPCADLLPGSDLDLAEAAHISQIVRDRPAPRRRQVESADQTAPQLATKAITSGSARSEDGVEPEKTPADRRGSSKATRR